MSDQVTPMLRVALAFTIGLVIYIDLFTQFIAKTLTLFECGWLVSPIVIYIILCVVLPDYYWWPNHQAERVERIQIKFDEKEA